MSHRRVPVGGYCSVRRTQPEGGQASVAEGTPPAPIVETGTPPALPVPLDVEAADYTAAVSLMESDGTRGS